MREKNRTSSLVGGFLSRRIIERRREKLQKASPKKSQKPRIQCPAQQKTPSMLYQNIATKPPKTTPQHGKKTDRSPKVRKNNRIKHLSGSKKRSYLPKLAKLDGPKHPPPRPRDRRLKALAKLPLSSRTQPTTVEAIVSLHNRLPLGASGRGARGLFRVLEC